MRRNHPCGCPVFWVHNCQTMTLNTDSHLKSKQKYIIVYNAACLRESETNTTHWTVKSNNSTWYGIFHKNQQHKYKSPDFSHYISTEVHLVFVNWRQHFFILLRILHGSSIRLIINTFPFISATFPKKTDVSGPGIPSFLNICCFSFRDLPIKE